MKICIASIKTVDSTVSHYQDQRVRIGYQTWRGFPAVVETAPTVRMRAVRGTNGGRYAYVNSNQEEQVFSP